jgi:putative oxidoreductase
MSTRHTIVRVLLGLIFVVFGLDGLVHFMPLPPMPPPARAVIDVLMSYGIFQLAKGIEIAAGLMLLANVRVPLAVLLLVPVVVNIAWFDAALDPMSLPVVVLLVALMAMVAWPVRGQLQRVWATA